jgi:hypothetical protein
VFNTDTVSLIEEARDNLDANVLTRSLLATFERGAMDVAVKRQNTARQPRAT